MLAMQPLGDRGKVRPHANQSNIGGPSGRGGNVGKSGRGYRGGYKGGGRSRGFNISQPWPNAKDIERF